MFLLSNGGRFYSYIRNNRNQTRWNFDCSNLTLSFPINVIVNCSLTKKEIKFHLHLKDCKWDRKCIFMNFACCNGSPQQIPLRQLPFANEAKPHSHCRGFWAMFLFLSALPWKYFVEKDVKGQSNIWLTDEVDLEVDWIKISLNVEGWLKSFILTAIY